MSPATNQKRTDGCKERKPAAMEKRGKYRGV